MRTPPDWDAAEIHGKASIINKAIINDEDFNEKNVLCECCLNKIPDYHDLYPICEDLADSDNPGLELFFKLNTYLGIIFLVTSITYFVPMIILISNAYNSIKSNIPIEASYIGLVSIGIFTYDPVT